MSVSELPPEPVLITAKGEMNTVAWCAWYRSFNQVSALKAQYLYNERVQAMPEPEITTKSGKISKLWIKWYRMRKKVSTNVAIGVAKRKLNAIAEGKQPLHEHITVYW